MPKAKPKEKKAEAPVLTCKWCGSTKHVEVCGSNFLCSKCREEWVKRL